ncbi:hypothetical protein GW750_02510 [bacterium]|nr:hypothetical protein [bacterium]
MCCIIMNTQITKEVESDQQVLYVPSEVERKKVLVMYLLFGIIISITKESLSSYEYSHLKQATGRWLLSCFFFIVSMVLVFIPFLNILPFLVALGLLGVWSICVYHARH